MSAQLHSQEELRDLYRELILDHARSPRHFGKLEGATHSAEGINPLCGDKLKMYLSIDADNQISAAKFEGSGCAISVASASLLTDTVIGMRSNVALDYFAELVARLSGQPVDVIADAERRQGFIERALSTLATSGATMAYEASIEHFNPHGDAEALIRAAIDAIAAEGSVVIGAHAAAMQLGGGPDVLRVLLTASEATRIARIRDEIGLDADAAAKALRESDKARRDYFRRFYHISDELPVHYDVIVNTDHVTFDQAIGLIVTLAT